MDFLKYCRDCPQHADRSHLHEFQETCDIGDPHVLPKDFEYLESFSIELKDDEDCQQEGRFAYRLFSEYGKGGLYKIDENFDKQESSLMECFEEIGDSTVTYGTTKFFILLNQSFHGLPFFGPEVS